MNYYRNTEDCTRCEKPLGSNKDCTRCIAWSSSNDDTQGLINKDLLQETMTQRGIDEIVKPADSVSLAKLAGKAFTITKTEPSAYDGQPGFKITTKDSYD